MAALSELAAPPIPNAAMIGTAQQATQATAATPNQDLALFDIFDTSCWIGTTA
jgi:hypothetical protein